MALNPNWPRLSAEFQPSASPYYGSGLLTGYTDFTKRLIREWSTGRGRQYELNQIEPGKANLIWDNRDGQLDPTNTSSIYNGLLLPYRAWRMRMQWPPTNNLLTADQATAGESTPIAPGAIPASMYVGAFYGTPVIASSATAWQGTQVYQTPVGSSVATGHDLLYIQYLPIQATSPAGSVQYTLSFYVRSVTSGANPQVAAQIEWMNAAGTLVSASAGTAATLTGATGAGWTRVTVTATPPTGAVYANIAVTLTGSAPTSSWSFQADGVQFEIASSASAWTESGLWYPLYAAMAERYPQAFDNHGTFGTVSPIIVDTFALLSNVLLADPLTSAIFTPAGGSPPSFAYLLADPSGSSAFADSTGTRITAQSVNSKYGAGTVSSGTTLTAATPAGLPLGAPGQTVTTLSSTAGCGVQFDTNPISWINLPPTKNGATGPGLGTGLGYTRMIAFKLAATPAYRATLWNAQNESAVNSVGMFIETNLALSLALDNGTYTGLGLAGGTADIGNWHLAWLGMAADGSEFIAGMDNSVSTYVGGSGNYTFPGGFSSDLVGAVPVSWDPYAAAWNFEGDIADVVEWPFLLTTAQISTIYTAWKTAFSGDSSGQRYARILGWAGYTGPTAIDTGNSTSLGPATDVVGIDAFSALEAVTETENGQHFVARDGTITFYARQRRYNETGAAMVYATFGENIGSGEWPYEMFATDFDTAHLANDVTITQVSTNQQVVAIDATSQKNYGSQTLTQSNQSTSLQEVQDQASYLVSRYKDPHQRINKLTIHPSAMAAQHPGIWPVVLGLELGTRVQANRRPPSPAATDSLPVFIEQINWTVKGIDVKVDLQAAPADLTPYGLFTSLHATLKNAVTGPTNTLVLNPLADAATNPAAGTLTGGQQLVLDYGLGVQETVTIAPGGVQATSPGYTSVTVTLTANTTQLHSANATVSEVMPAGSASTTLYDSSAVFGTALFGY